MGELIHGGILVVAFDLCGLDSATDRDLHVCHDLTDEALTFGTRGACHLFGLWLISDRRGIVFFVGCCCGCGLSALALYCSG